MPRKPWQTDRLPGAGHRFLPAVLLDPDGGFIFENAKCVNNDLFAASAAPTRCAAAKVAGEKSPKATNNTWNKALLEFEFI